MIRLNFKDRKKYGKILNMSAWVNALWQDPLRMSNYGYNLRIKANLERKLKRSI